MSARQHLIICAFICLLHCAFAFVALSSEDSTKDGRIVGGQEVPINIFPHQISLRYKGSHICGGAILNSTTVITAAHCVRAVTDASLFTIRAGSSEYQYGGYLRNAKEIIPHEHFNKPTLYNNDIALIRLDEPLPFSSDIRPIGLVTKDMVIERRQWLFVSGWGATAMKKRVLAPRLRFTTVVLQDYAKCVNTYRKTGSVTKNMLCAGVGQGGHDSCQGDSGGPLTTNVGNDQKLLGIVSWGYGCALKDYPGIYTRITAYLDWIRKNME